MMMTFGANRCLTIKTKKGMKKNLFMVAAVALMALVSCNKEEINGGVVETPQPQEPSVIVEFTASLDAEDTKTTLDATNKKTLWSADDAISINGQKFTIKEIQEDGKAVFVNTAELPANFAAPYTAKYPYQANGTVSIPATQNVTEGQFDPSAVAAVAYSDDMSLVFKNATSLLKFQVSATCDQVVLSSDDALAGTLTVTLPEEFDGVPTFAAANKSVTVKGTFVTGKDYYVAVLPGTKSNFKVSVYDKEVKSAPSVTINRSMIVNMGKIPAPTLKLYVEDDTDYSGLYLYMFDAAGDNTWPGTQVTATETVNGVSYKVYTVPTDRMGKEYTYIFNNNKGAQVEENKTIKFNQDNYLRLTKKYSEVVDASNKGKDDPLTLYIRNDKNWSKLNYYMWIDGGGNNQGWPGKSADMKKITKIENSTYVYVELGASYNWKKIIINNGSQQTADLTIPDTKDDIYVSNNGYIWKGAAQTL